MTGHTTTPDHEVLLESSRVVHANIDPSVKTSGVKLPEEEEGGDHDKIITHARRALPDDGLLSISEFTALFRSTLRSAMEEAQRNHRSQEGSRLTTFGDRAQLSHGQNGAHEPEYTSYTHFWQSVLGEGISTDHLSPITNI